jgi:hypothetical protein
MTGAEYVTKNGWVYLKLDDCEYEICSQLTPVGRKWNDDAGWQLEVEFNDLENRLHRSSINVGDLAGSGASYLKDLLSYGLLIDFNAKPLLRDYLMYCYENTKTIE